MSVIRDADSRRTETPNGLMTTYASPSQGGSGLSVWRVEFHPGKTGPFHAFDAEQVWTILSGHVRMEVDGESCEIGTGDTVVIAADVPRQMFTDPESGFTAVVAATSGTRVYNPQGVTTSECDMGPRDTERTTPPWIA